jgi:hypothetical protein
VARSDYALFEVGRERLNQHSAFVPESAYAAITGVARLTGANAATAVIPTMGVITLPLAWSRQGDRWPGKAAPCCAGSVCRYRGADCSCPDAEHSLEDLSPALRAYALRQGVESSIVHGVPFS